jgi:hypothetical protein
MLSDLQTRVDKVLPPPKRAAARSRVEAFAHERPLLASFVFSHLVFSGIPLLLFTLQAVSILLFSLGTALVVGVFCALGFTAVCVGIASLFLVPVLLVTGFLGFAAWCWAWMGWYILRWIGVLEQGGNVGVGGAGANRTGSTDSEGKFVKVEQPEFTNGMAVNRQR